MVVVSKAESLSKVMRQMGWKVHTGGAKCIWEGCDNQRAGELLCLYHKKNPANRPIDRAA